MDYQSIPNLVEMYFDRVEHYGDTPFLWAKADGEWHATSWRESANIVRNLSRALADLGVEPGDRVGLVAENRPEWLMSDVAIMAAGGVTVPAYTTNTVDDHLHVLSDSGAKGIIVSTNALANRVCAAASQCPDINFVISIEALGEETFPFETMTWDEALQRGAGALNAKLPAPADIARDSTSCLIYTSGTSGKPKGVMLSHGAIICNCMGAHKFLLQLPGFEEGKEIFLSFLPLSHSYEHTAGQFLPISIGAQIYYSEGVDKLTGNISEVRPTVLTAVPRLYEAMHGRIIRGVEQAGGLKQTMFMKAVKIGQRRYEDPASLGPIDRMLDGLLDKLVRSKVQERFGGRLKAFVSGGAPLNYDIGVFFTGLGLTILQGYGMTESAPVISCNPPNPNKMRTVGPPMKDVEVRIASDGEILVRGELVMQGYWNNPEATAEVIRDGWLHTGDIGDIDEDGYIRITDRRKSHYCEFGWGQRRPATCGRYADHRTGNRSSHGLWRQAPASGRAYSPRYGLRQRLDKGEWRREARILGARGGRKIRRQRPGCIRPCKRAPEHNRAGPALQTDRGAFQHRQRDADTQHENPPPHH